jgi:hypothetical protein
MLSYWRNDVRLRGLASILCLAICATSAEGEPNTPFWKTVGDWQIRVDTTLNNGCFMFGSYTQGEFLRVGFDRANRNGYAMIGNAKWASLEAGHEYPLVFEFAGFAPWNGNATGFVLSGGAIVLGIKFSDPEVMRQLAHSSSLTISYNDRVISTLPLKGTEAAVAELVRCQNAVDAHAPSSPGPSDPFATGSGSTNDDPFSKK